MAETPPHRKAAAALSFDPGRAALPQIRAAGHGALAEAILRLAFEHGIKVREDADLAEILAVMELDSEIPPEAMVAVAEILIYLYRANGRMEAGQDEAGAAEQGAAGETGGAGGNAAFDSAAAIGEKEP